MRLTGTWSTEKEEGIRWSPETTVVLTDNPQHMIAQPSNFILLPSFIYKTNIAAADDQNLLMMITCLKDLVRSSLCSLGISLQF